MISLLDNNVNIKKRDKGTALLSRFLWGDMS